MERPILQIRDLEKSYDQLEVLRGVDIDVARGEKLAIIGPSGSGKSTLARLIIGLEQPTGGTIEINGERLWEMRRGDAWVRANRAHVRSVRQQVGFVFQHFNLFPHMTVLGNITLAPRQVLGWPKDQAREKAMELLNLVGLAEKADQYPGKLSGGQKQRVAIARALALEPAVMLFDEVTSALDPELVGEVLTVLRDLAQAQDITMLIVTHEMRFAREIADRVLFFDEGVIIEEGPPDVIFEAPAQNRTRAFLRSILGEPSEEVASKQT